MNNLLLLKEAKNGNEEAFNKFFLENQKLVFSLLKRFEIKRSEYEDILQEANYALCMAIKKYDFSYGVSFSTYAVPLILGEIRRFFRDNSLLKVSRSIKELVPRINEYLLNNPKATLEDLSLYFNESKERILEGLTLKNYVYSLDNKINEDNDETLINNIKDETLSLEDKVNLKIGMEKLEKKEKLIIELRYFGGYSQSEISKRLNISQVQVSRIETKALNRLKEII